MRITTNKTSKGTSYYIIRSIRRDGKRSSEVVENLGTDKEIIEKYGCSDVDAWVHAHLDELNRMEKEKDHKVLIPFNSNTQIPMDQQHQFNIGYLFLQQIYYDLKLPQICNKIKSRYEFDYDLDAILSRIVYGRILYPSSKLSCFEQSHQLLEAPQFELHQIYRALSVLAKESDEIQASLYENSKTVLKRQTGVLYYDCTNFYFEIEKESGLRQYGVSKEHRPNPIVQMGLFMDKSGIPLAMSITPGNTNEQTTLKPLEMKLMKDFELSQFVVCTDAGLSSEANRKFNNIGGRGFITTQSIKKMKAGDQSWCLDPTGWHLSKDQQSYDLHKIDESDPEIQELTFYKQKLIESYDAERDVSFQQALIVTYSIKYKNYQKAIRDQQITRARKALESGKNKIDTYNSNDYRRLVKKISVTSDGEVAPKKIYSVDQISLSKSGFILFIIPHRPCQCGYIDYF